MRLSTRARYALRMMLDIAKYQKETVPVSLADVAKRTKISRGYLEQLVIALKSGRLLRGVRGKNGGYLLQKRPEETSLRAIIEAAIGPISILDCLESPGSCLRTDYCECRLVYVMINRRIVDVLEEFSLADLKNPSWMAAMRRNLSLGEQPDPKVSVKTTRTNA